MVNLFTPIKIADKDIKNRIVMPPMVCFGWAESDGQVTEKHIKHYEARAKGGAGIIILEALCVEKDGRLSPDQLGIWSDEHIDGLKKIVAACHKYGAVVLGQIHHAGIKTHDAVSEEALSPSDYIDGNRKGSGMSISEINYIQEKFVEAALRAQKAGFDGVELHGAHGYLIDQMMSPSINKRNDEYGGTLYKRTRFAVEIVRAIREKTGIDFIIGHRMGGNEPTINEGIEIGKILEEAGVDVLHVSSGMGDAPVVPEGFPYNWIVYCGIEIKRNVNVPVITVNGIRTPAQAAYLIDNGLADFAAIGKGMLVDPEWANKAAESMEVNKCFNCRNCSWFKDSNKCPGLKVV